MNAYGVLLLFSIGMIVIPVGGFFAAKGIIFEGKYTVSSMRYSFINSYLRDHHFSMFKYCLIKHILDRFPIAHSCLWLTHSITIPDCIHSTTILCHMTEPPLIIKCIFSNPPLLSSNVGILWWLCGRCYCVGCPHPHCHSRLRVHGVERRPNHSKTRVEIPFLIV